VVKLSIGCEIKMGAVTDEFTKRIMFGNFMGIFDNEVENAAKEIKALAIAHIREHLYPGHGYLTGNLSESYQGTVTSGGGQATITIFTECVYAAFVNTEHIRWQQEHTLDLDYNRLRKKVMIYLPALLTR